MRIIQPYASIISCPDRAVGIELLKKIEWCGRISHRSEEAQLADSWEKFIPAVVLKHGDWSIVEHASVTVDSVTDRGISHESVRHRLFSYTQESTRFVNYEKKMPPAFVYPQVDKHCQFCDEGYEPTRVVFAERVNTIFSQEMGNIPIYNNKRTWEHQHVQGYAPACALDWDWLDAIHAAEQGYKTLLAKKWRPQEARSVFPNALATRIVTTGNLRNWRAYFMQRVTMEAHPQMRQISIPLLDEFKQRIPILFDDILPEQKQSVSMSRMR